MSATISDFPKAPRMRLAPDPLVVAKLVELCEQPLEAAKEGRLRGLAFVTCRTHAPGQRMFGAGYNYDQRDTAAEQALLAGLPVLHHVLVVEGCMPNTEEKPHP